LITCRHRAHFALNFAALSPSTMVTDAAKQAQV